MTPMPAVGKQAPDFTLHSTPDQTVSLSQFRGHPVVLAFYPADWSPVCGDQMALYNELLSRVPAVPREVIGISVDGAWCHAAFAQDRKLHFPLLADFEPKGEVARRYGVYQVPEGISERALFVIDARRHGALELCLADRHQSGRRRHPGSAGEATSHRRERKMSQLKPDVGPADHAQGSLRGAVGAGGIRRLPMSVLRRAVSGDQSGAGRHGR